LQLFAVLPELYNMQSHDSFHEAYDDRFVVCWVIELLKLWGL
jgi:hypothetical protein